jgi:hypothetical protein
MTGTLNKNFIAALVTLYNLAIIVLFSYIIFWKGHSGWWFFVAILFMHVQGEK